VLLGLAGAGLALGLARGPDAVIAGSQRRKKPGRPRPNAYGCLNVGDRCKRAAHCCSGICEGKKGRRSCRAHGAGGCVAGTQPKDCGGTNVDCTTSLGRLGFCATTTGNAAYCWAVKDCVACRTDADCRTARDGLFGPEAACLRCASCTATGGTLCAGAKGYG
jgi:hypothetical protein